MYTHTGIFNPTLIRLSDEIEETTYEGKHEFACAAMGWSEEHQDVQELEIFYVRTDDGITSTQLAETLSQEYARQCQSLGLEPCEDWILTQVDYCDVDYLPDGKCWIVYIEPDMSDTPSLKAVH
jgi:hypothetical protein